MMADTLLPILDWTDWLGLDPGIYYPALDKKTPLLQESYTFDLLLGFSSHTMKLPAQVNVSSDLTFQVRNISIP